MRVFVCEEEIMYLSRFGVKNYKCLGEIDIPLTPIHVLIGQNDAGKTSLLEAMAALYASIEERVDEMFPGPWSGRELVFYGSDEARVELSGEWSSLPIGPQFEEASSTSGRTLRHEWPPESQLPNPAGGYGFVVDFDSFRASKKCSIRERRVRPRAKYPWAPGETEPRVPFPVASVISPSDAERAAGEAYRQVISPMLQPAHKYRLDAKVMSVPAAIDADRRFRLDPDGFGLPTLLDDILGFDPEVFLRIRRQFCEFFPQYKSVRVESEMALERHYSANGIHHSAQRSGKGIVFETRNGDPVRAQQASDGAILFLGFLALAHVPDPPTLLLLEEPENGIYPRRLGEVIKMLKELVHRTDGTPFPQIVMSTHSPYVLSFFEPEEVTFLSRPADKPDGPVRARPLRDALNIRERLDGGEFYLGELWYNLSEEELFGGP